MGEMAKALATPKTIVYRGEEYALHALDDDDVAFLETYLEERAYEGVIRAERYLTPDKAEAQWAQVSRDIAAGIYSHGSETWGKFIKSKPGLQRIYWMMLRKGCAEMTLKLAGQIFDAHNEELNAKANELNRVDDPNSPAPSREGATIPA